MQAVSGVLHAGHVLGLFTSETPEWGAAEASRALGLSRSHAHRLLSTLSEIGLLEKREPGGRFRLSWSWFSYASVILASDRLFAVGMPLIKRIAAVYGVRPMLALWANGTILTMQPTPQPAVGVLDLGQSGAIGLALLAGLEKEELERAAAPLRTVPGFPDEAELALYIQRARSGQLIVRTEAEPRRRWWLAVPIADATGRIVAALGLCVMDSAQARNRALITDLDRAASTLSFALTAADEARAR